MRGACWVVAVALGTLGWSCPAQEVVTRQVDPAVDYGDNQLTAVTGTPTLEVGYYQEQLYVPLRPGDLLPVVFGTQGGTWSMPAVRSRGVGAPVWLECTLTTLAGERLGQARAREQPVPTNDGWLEVEVLPIPVTHAPPREADPITDLYGLEATLACSEEDDAARRATISLQLVLKEG
jgi:hypothetical protein